MSRKKLILTYLFLVGAPLLGLLGILRSGERLAAPVSVGGAWNLEGDFTGLTNATFRRLLASVSQPFLAISQSGPHLTFTLNNPEQTTLAGTMRQNSVTMGGESSAGDTSRGCANPQTIRLQAALGQQGQQRTLVGTLSIAGCPECATIPFRAVRLSPPVKDGQ